jgi:hypothetical protein
MIRLDTHETWEKQDDGTMLLIKSEQEKIEIKTDEELIKEKQDELLTIYNEILLLQNKAL